MKAHVHDDEGRFKSVEMATFHAVAVQGGFTTDEIEAERMTRSDDPYYQEMGRQWRAAQVRHVATNLTRLLGEEGKSIWQCSSCLKSDRDPVHIKHRSDCRDRYGSGTPGCEGCDHQAEKVKASGCTKNPYAGFCGSAFDDKPQCVCGRPQSTD